MQSILKPEPNFICLLWQMLRTCCHITTDRSPKDLWARKARKSLLGYVIYTLLPSLQRVNQKKLAHLYLKYAIFTPSDIKLKRIKKNLKNWDPPW